MNDILARIESFLEEEGLNYKREGDEIIMGFTLEIEQFVIVIRHAQDANALVFVAPNVAHVDSKFLTKDILLEVARINYGKLWGALGHADDGELRFTYAYPLDDSNLGKGQLRHIIGGVLKSSQEAFRKLTPILIKATKTTK